MKVFSRRNLILFAVLAAAVAGLYLWQRTMTPVTPVRIARAQVGSLVQTFRTNGVVEPVDFQEIRALEAGRVVAVLVKEGARVKAGQSLARLDDSAARAAVADANAQVLEAQQAVAKAGSGAALNQLEAEIATAKADLALASSNQQRDQVLLKQRAISQLEYDESAAACEKASEHLTALEKERDTEARDLHPLEEEQARARLEQAQTVLKNAQNRLRATQVPSPIDGTLLAEAPRPGTLVSTGDLLAKVGNTDQLQVRAFIDQPDFSSIQTGTPVQITSNGFPGEVWHGEIRSLSAELTTIGKRVVGEAICSIRQGESRLPVSSNVDLTFTSREIPNVMLVPIDAVLQRNNRNYVYLIKRGVLTPQEVQVGASNTDSVIVRSGLNPGDSVFNDLEVQPLEGLRVEPR
jgi:HlyD family secretion protein